MDPPPTINDGPIHSRWNHGMSKGGLTIHWADIGNESTVRNTTSEMRWWRTNSFGGGEKDGEWNGSLFLGRKGLEGRVVCGVVCGREGEKEGKGEEEEEREWIYLSLLLPINSPAGLTPCGDTLSKHSPTHYHSTPIHRTQTQKWGIPTSSPPGEREEKEEEKSTLYTYYPQFFSLGENPQTPPSNWDAQEKDKKSEGAR